MTYTIIGGILFAISIFLYLTTLFDKRKREAFLADQLADARSKIHLYKTIIEEQKAALDGTGLKEFKSTYAPSESDLIHYKNEKTMAKSIRGRLAHNLAEDIIAAWGDPLKTPEGEVRLCRPCNKGYFPRLNNT